MSTSGGLRRTARRGRLTPKPQADFRNSLSLRCIARHPSVQFAPSRLRSFGCLTTVSHSLVITAHRHIRPLQTKRAVQPCGQNRLLSTLTRTAAIDRAMARSALHIARGRERGRAKASGSAVGGLFRRKQGENLPLHPLNRSFFAPCNFQLREYENFLWKIRVKICVTAFSPLPHYVDTQHNHCYSFRFRHVFCRL